MKLILVVVTLALSGCSQNTNDAAKPFATSSSNSSINSSQIELTKIAESTSPIKSEDVSALTDQGITLNPDELAALNSLALKN